EGRVVARNRDGPNRARPPVAVAVDRDDPELSVLALGTDVVVVLRAAARALRGPAREAPALDAGASRVGDGEADRVRRACGDAGLREGDRRRPQVVQHPPRAVRSLVEAPPTATARRL